MTSWQRVWAEILLLAGFCGVDRPPQAPPVQPVPARAPQVVTPTPKSKFLQVSPSFSKKPPTPKGYPLAPKGYRWERYPSGQWGLVQDGVPTPKQPVTPAPEVAVHRPFVQRSGTILTTPATVAAGSNTRSAVGTVTGHIRTLVPNVGTPGSTNNCPTGVG